MTMNITCEENVAYQGGCNLSTFACSMNYSNKNKKLFLEIATPPWVKKLVMVRQTQ